MRPPERPISNKSNEETIFDFESITKDQFLDFVLVFVYNSVFFSFSFNIHFMRVCVWVFGRFYLFDLVKFGVKIQNKKPIFLTFVHLHFSNQHTQNGFTYY